MSNSKTERTAPKPVPVNGWVHKCDVDGYLGRNLPVPTQVVSNEEFIPPAQTRQQKQVEAHLLDVGERHAKRLGVSRREFFETSCGMAAAFGAMNAVFGYFFRVDAAELFEPGAAETRTDYFIFDVQTHHVAAGRNIPALLGFRRTGRAWNPELRKREPHPDDLFIENYIKEIFLDSETDMVVISGFPSPTDETNILPPDRMVKTRDWINRLSSSRRVVSHGLMSPDLGQRNLESMQVQTEKLKIEAWKGYPGQPLGPRKDGWWLDDEKEAYPVLEFARKRGIRNICLHKGLPLAGFNVDHCHPRDLVKASKDFPDLNFLVYHSAFKSLENAVPAAADGFQKSAYVPWTSDLCELRKKNPHMKNVYMELGSTFGMTVITHPLLSCHMLGMMIDAFGDDHVLWGTDSIWWGSPQWQIEALRRLEMPDTLIKRFKYKPLTSAVKAKIFGLNAARVYKIDPKARLNPLPNDYIEKLRTMYRQGAAQAPSNTQYGWIRA